MKLAEALSIRKDLQKKIEQLKSRILNNVKVQEGELTLLMRLPEEVRLGSIPNLRSNFSTGASRAKRPSRCIEYSAIPPVDFTGTRVGTGKLKTKI